MSSVTVTLLSEGNRLDVTTSLLAVDVQRTLNRIPTARLTLADGDIAQRAFPHSSAPHFAPGQPLEIQMGAAEEEGETVFTGVIVGQRIEARSGRSHLHLELKDPAIKMTGTRERRAYQDMLDSDIMRELINTHSLTPGDITDTETEHKLLVQYDATDWDFLLLRAEAVGFVVAVTDGEFSVGLPTADGQPAYTLRYGLDEILDFDFATDATHQHTTLTGVGWDIAEQALGLAEEATAYELPLGEMIGTDAADALGYPPQQLTSSAPLGEGEAAAWATGYAVRGRFTFQQGRISVRGSAVPRLLDVLGLEGFGVHFDGQTIVTGLRHAYDAHHGWRTHLQFGLPAQLFAHRPDISPPAAGGLLPAMRGLHIAVVDAFEEDPNGELRVLVRLGGLAEDQPPLWARIARPDAGAERGYFFTPEAGDQVVVGFINEDPRHPVVLGALHSSANAQPTTLAPPDADNTEKGIVTRSGTTIRFVDGDTPSIAIETPGGNLINLSDEDEGIHLEDQHGNTITLNADGIAITSAGDLILTASGNVEIEGS